MTRRRSQKKRVRAHAAATGRTYLDAATALARTDTLDITTAARPVLAEHLCATVMNALSTAGWPAVSPPEQSLIWLDIEIGPIEIEIGRAAEPRSGLDSSDGAPEIHPDDPTEYDLTSPLVMTVSAPYMSAAMQMTTAGIDRHEIPSDWQPFQIVDEIDQVVAAARRRDLAGLPSTVSCSICGDTYPKANLLKPSADIQRVCPGCVFHVDVFNPDVIGLAHRINKIFVSHPAVAAGWAAVQALMVCLGGRSLWNRLDAAKGADLDGRPRLWWAAWPNVWIWLPPAGQRPAAFDGLGCGASLGRIVSCVDRAHPELRDTFRAGLWNRTPYIHDLRDARNRLDLAIDRLWPAVVAYAVAMTTQHAERPQHRSPWHVTESFELVEWVRALDSDVHYLVANAVLREGILTVRAALTQTA